MAKRRRDWRAFSKGRRRRSKKSERESVELNLGRIGAEEKNSDVDLLPSRHEPPRKTSAPNQIRTSHGASLSPTSHRIFFVEELPVIIFRASSTGSGPFVLSEKSGFSPQVEVHLLIVFGILKTRVVGRLVRKWLMNSPRRGTRRGEMSV